MCSELMFNDNNKNVLSKNIKLFQKSPAVLKQCFFSAPVKVIKNPQPEVRQLSKPKIENEVLYHSQLANRKRKNTENIRVNMKIRKYMETKYKNTNTCMHINAYKCMKNSNLLCIFSLLFLLLIWQQLCTTQTHRNKDSALFTILFWKNNIFSNQILVFYLSVSGL